jgi:hypothetical protein
MEKHRELIVSYMELPAQVQSYIAMNEQLASYMQLSE